MTGQRARNGVVGCDQLRVVGGAHGQTSSRSSHGMARCCGRRGRCCDSLVRGEIRNLGEEACTATNPGLATPNLGAQFLRGGQGRNGQGADMVSGQWSEQAGDKFGARFYKAERTRKVRLRVRFYVPPSTTQARILRES